MKNKRLASIDNYRALIMLLMIFVIDVGNVSNIPYWIGHAAMDEDRLGFADIIFPCFMFIIGLSIPHAIQNRKNLSNSNIKILTHIFFRSISLLIMGLLVVNLDNINPQSMLMGRNVWMLLMVVGIFLIWNDYPSSKLFNTVPKLALQALGVILLCFIAYAYKGPNDSWMQIHWWGILGLLGWAYCLCALIYLFFGKSTIIVAVATLILLLLNINEFVGGLNIRLVISASNYFSVMLGVLCSVLYLDLKKKSNPYLVIWAFGGLGFVLLAFGFATRPIWEISKIRATPSWTAICGGISIFIYMFFLYFSKIKAVKHFFSPIAAGGYATLSCYFCQYFLYALMGLFLLSWPSELSSGSLGILRSLLFAIGVILATAAASHLKVRLKI